MKDRNTQSLPGGVAGSSREIEGGRSAIGYLIHIWDRFWFSPTDPATLCFMRVLTGILVFYVMLTYSWDLFAYVGPEAWVDKEVADWVQKEMPIYSLPWEWGDQTTQMSQGNFYWSFYYHVTDTGWIIALHVFFLVCSLLFTLGLWTRITGILSWLAAMMYVQRATNTVFGLDTMMLIVLAYLNLGPCGAMFSLDRWLEKRRALQRGEPIPEIAPSYGANFAIRLTQVHFCIIYFATGTSKLLGSTWWAGTSLNLVLLNANFAPLHQLPYYNLMKFLGEHRLLWEFVMTTGIAYTLLLEIAFPFLVWDRRWRWVFVSGSILLHAVIGLFMGLVTFSLMMMTMVLSFVPPEVIRAAFNGLGASLGRMTSPRAGGVDQKADKLVMTS